MYRVIKVLNNNSVLVFNEERKKEYILLGSGIGFGRRTSEQFESAGNAKIYSLVTRRKQQSVLKTVNGIEPVFIEATGKIIDIAEEMLSGINKDILLPLADHIALAAKRARENTQLPNPFTADIKLLFPGEFNAALKGRKILKEMTGYEISDDEAGFIALHIHAGLAGERVSETVNTTRIIDGSIEIIQNHFKGRFCEQSLGYSRLMSHLYYMTARARNNEAPNLDINDFVSERYPEAAAAAEEVCAYMESQFKKQMMKDEMGFLALHIQRIITA